MTDYHIQHADINIGPANYRNLDDRVLVRKIFSTIQGEGPFSGYPAIFIRLAGCNRGQKLGMGCEFCDTDFNYEKGEWLTPEAIIKQMAALNAKSRLIIITGGEPMMQAGLSNLLRWLCEAKYRVQIESNGDRIIDDWEAIIRARLNIYLVVSPKVTRGSYLDLKPAVISAASAFKFLIDADPASPYFNIPAYARMLSPLSIYLSPIAVYKRAVEIGEIASAWDHALIDAERTRANYRYAAELAREEGFMFSCQTHLFMGAE